MGKIGRNTKKRKAANEGYVIKTPQQQVTRTRFSRKTLENYVKYASAFSWPKGKEAGVFIP